MMRWSVSPRATIILATIVGSAVRYRLLDRRADAVQVVRQMIRMQGCLHRHYSAADIHADCSGNDGALGRNHAAHGRTNAPMHVWHRRHPLVDKRQLRDV